MFQSAHWAAAHWTSAHWRPREDDGSAPSDGNQRARALRARDDRDREDEALLLMIMEAIE